MCPNIGILTPDKTLRCTAAVEGTCPIGCTQSEPIWRRQKLCRIGLNELVQRRHDLGKFRCEGLQRTPPGGTEISAACEAKCGRVQAVQNRWHLRCMLLWSHFSTMKCHELAAYLGVYQNVQIDSLSLSAYLILLMLENFQDLSLRCQAIIK